MTTNDSHKNAGPRPPADQSGVRGFDAKFEGHAKADHPSTSSFGGVPDTLTSTITQQPQGGQEEGAHMRSPTTSSVARVVTKK